MNSILSLRLVLCTLLLAGFLGDRAQAADGLWQTDFEAARKQAKAEGKLLFVLFDGSDWCPLCMDLQRDVFEKEPFRTEFAVQFVPVAVDFPHQINLDEAVRKQNAALAKRYRVFDVPTALLLNDEGEVVTSRVSVEIAAADFPLQVTSLAATYTKIATLKKKLLGTLDGLPRAKVLDEIVEQYGEFRMCREEALRFGQEIVELDADGRGGLKDKYEFYLKRSRAFTLLFDQKKVDEANLAYDEVLSLTRIDDETKQVVRFEQARGLYLNEDYVAAIAQLRVAHELVPKSAIVPRIEAMTKSVAPYAEAQKASVSSEAKLNGATGLERAALLDELVVAQTKMSQIAATPTRQAKIAAWKREILELDPDNAAGLRAKYQPVQPPAPPSSEAPGLSGAQKKRLETAEKISLHVVRLFRQRRFREAKPKALEALAIYREVLGENHIIIARALGNVGIQSLGEWELAEAKSYLNQALEASIAAVGEKDIRTASALDRLGLVHQAMKDFATAKTYHRRAVSILSEALKPKDPELIQSLRNLADVHKFYGDELSSEPIADRAAAATEYREAHKILLQLIDIEKQTHGNTHLRVAQSLSDVSQIDKELGRPVKARESLQQALEIKKELLGEDHQETLELIEKIGNLYSEEKDFAASAISFRQVLAAQSKSFGARSIQAAAVHNILGLILSSSGDYREAENHYRQALAIRTEVLGPNHANTANTVGNLAGLLIDQRRYAEAVDGLLEGVRLRQSLSEEVFAKSSEAESLIFVNNNDMILNRLASEWRHVDRPIEDLYEQIWRARGAVFQLATSRRGLIELSLSPGASASKLHKDWIDARHDVARLSLAPAIGPPELVAARRDELQRASARKEDLERRLVAQLPEDSRKQTLRARPYTDLARVLPAGSCFVDLVRYTRFDQDPNVAGERGRKWTPSYTAFVLSAERGLRRIDLGPAAPIEAATREWRKGIVDGTATEADRVLRRLVWEPTAEAFPADTTTVYLSPDGPLTALPWGALPGNKPETVLLEEYAIAIVPNGRVLLSELERPATPSAEGSLLAIGGVDYGALPADIGPAVQIAGLRAAAVDEKQPLFWPELPGTLNEVSGIEALRGERPLIKLVGNEAGTMRVMTELPKARWAIFATHGFFADSAMRSAMHLDESSFRDGMKNEQGAFVGRNPMLLSGLVLAGANLARPTDAAGLPQGDGGILTAETVAGLPLSKLELAVLSACETGLGEVAGGEGSFGLQRAFHVAGCRNVVAGLWKVDDQATTALMRLFYENLWNKKQTPLTALRNAQLTILRDPQEITNNALRGLGAAKTLPGGERMAPKSTASRTDVRRWAAFQLSGAGK